METSRDIIQSLKEILEALRMVIIEEHDYTPTEEFLTFVSSHLRWLETLDNDIRLYDFRNKSYITQIKSCFTYPHPQFKGCITWYDELLDIAIDFRRIHGEIATIPINTLSEFKDLDKQLAPIVSKLDYILDRMPPADYETMHENNRELYYELNTYILNPERVEKIACKYGVDICGYLDAIDV